MFCMQAWCLPKNTHFAIGSITSMCTQDSTSRCLVLAFVEGEYLKVSMH